MENEIVVKDQSIGAEIVPVTEQTEMKQLSIWGNVEDFKQAQRMAQLLASSDIVPQNYRGKVADCVVAIDIAQRMGLPPISVMQGSQVVQGNFSWKGASCKAMIDNCGKYKKTRYVEVGQRGKDDWGFYLEATDKEDNVIKGVTVTMQMAKDEGWYGKSGSKWKTMPELMLKYRAAAFFMRTECSSLAMGFLTAEEQEDIAGSTERTNAVSDLLDSMDE